MKYEADLRAYEAPDATQALRTSYRNKIVYLTALEIDRNYNDFRNSFFGERAATETSLDIEEIGLTSAATLAAGETTKAILAAIATGVAGSRLSFNKNFFKERAPDLLISRMDAIRTAQWSQIYLKLKNSTDDNYSLYEAERDLVAYYQAGSLQAAFQNILAESGAAQEKADNEIRQQIEKKYGPLLGRLAPANELREIDALFSEFDALESSKQETQAKKVIESFLKSQPRFDFGPNADASDLEKVKFLYIVARDKDHTDVRRDLTKAFTEAKSQ